VVTALVVWERERKSGKVFFRLPANRRPFFLPVQLFGGVTPSKVQVKGDGE